MAAAEAHHLEVHDRESSFAQRAEKFFDTLATEDAVNSESVAALVAAVAYLGLKVTEAQVTEAVQEVARSTAMD